jgi:hypothetical protein
VSVPQEQVTSNLLVLLQKSFPLAYPVEGLAFQLSFPVADTQTGLDTLVGIGQVVQVQATDGSVTYKAVASTVAGRDVQGTID